MRMLKNIKSVIEYCKPTGEHWRVAASESKEVRVLLGVLAVMVGLFTLKIVIKLAQLVMTGNLLAIALVGMLGVLVFMAVLGWRNAGGMLKKQGFSTLLMLGIAVLGGALMIQQQNRRSETSLLLQAGTTNSGPLSPQLMVAVQQLVQQEPLLEEFMVNMNDYFIRQAQRNILSSDAYLSGYGGMNMEKVRRWMNEEQEQERETLELTFSQLLGG